MSKRTSTFITCDRCKVVVEDSSNGLYPPKWNTLGWSTISVYVHTEPDEDGQISAFDLCPVCYKSVLAYIRDRLITRDFDTDVSAQ